jgi:hypothetical protein
VTDLRATDDQGRRIGEGVGAVTDARLCQVLTEAIGDQIADRLVVDQHGELGASCGLLRVPAPAGDQAVFLDVFKMSLQHGSGPPGFAEPRSGRDREPSTKLHLTDHR